MSIQVILAWSMQPTELKFALRLVELALSAVCRRHQSFSY